MEISNLIVHMNTCYYFVSAFAVCDCNDLNVTNYGFKITILVILRK